MMGRLVMMVMVDALRHDYVTPEDAPFLHRMAQAGVRGSLAPSFGFEPDAAYFAGLSPEESDGGAQFWLKPGKRLFRGVPLFAQLDRLPHARWRTFVRKAVRGVAQWTARDPLPRRMAAPAHIPYDQLARFSLSMTQMADAPLAFGAPSLFDDARARGLEVFFHGFPAHQVKTDVVLQRFLVACGAEHDVAFVFMGDLDGIGHAFGPDSAERRLALRRIDAALEQMHSHARRHHQEVVLVVFGDHGMAEVRGQVDVRPAIRAAGLDVREDSWFLDSTMARFWVADPARRHRLREALGAVAGGRLIDDRLRAAYRIRYPHNAFGDEIFAVDDHLLVHPSFYADAVPPRGMHGYLPGCRDNESAFVIAGDGIEPGPAVERANMRRLHTTVLELMGGRSSHAAGLPSLLQSGAA